MGIFLLLHDGKQNCIASQRRQKHCEEYYLTLFTQQTNNWVEYLSCCMSCHIKTLLLGFYVTSTLTCHAAFKGRLWLLLPGHNSNFLSQHIAHFKLNGGLLQATITNERLPLDVQGMIKSSGTSAVCSHAAKFEFPWPLLNMLFPPGHADIGNQPKQTRYQ